jgi:tRNA dimethylallyltransferase
MSDTRIDDDTPIVIAGPTCSGKSSLALAVARATQGALICADSRQIYRGLRVASAGPDDEERAAVPHFLYESAPPDVVYDAGRFVADADLAIASCRRQGRRAILVGGNGMYLRAWRFGLSDVPGSDAGVRRALDEEIARDGLASVHARLAVVDAESAARISPADRVRIVRALEVFALTGERPSALRRSHDGGPPRQAAVSIVLTASSDWLAPRILARAEQMFAHGLVDEARALRDEIGVGHALLETLGVKEALAVADGTSTTANAIAETALRTRQYARRQRKWFAGEDWWTRLDAADADLLPRVLDAVGARTP